MKSAILCLTWLWLAALAAHSAPPFSHAETGIGLPNDIAGFVRGETKPYGDPSLGNVAISYQREQIAITIFIRKIDPKVFDSATAIVEESLAAVREMEKSGQYTHVKILKTEVDPANPKWAKAAFTAQKGDAPVISLIYATIKGEYAVKARISSITAKGDAIEKFVTEFQRRVDEAKR